MPRDPQRTQRMPGRPRTSSRMASSNLRAFWLVSSNSRLSRTAMKPPELGFGNICLSHPSTIVLTPESLNPAEEFAVDPLLALRPSPPTPPDPKVAFPSHLRI